MMIKHTIGKYANNTMHLHERDPQTGHPTTGAIRFSNVLDYDTDVAFPVMRKKDGEWVQTQTLKLSKLLKYPKHKNIIFDSLRRQSKGKYTWEMFLAERAAKLHSIGASTEPEPKKAKPKKTPPSEILTALLKQKPHSRAEMEAETGMDTEAVRKCITWMKAQEIIEKTTDKDGDGNSRWGLKQ